MRWLLDPLLFNYLIMALFIGALLRWAVGGSLWDALYWCGACLIHFSITFRPVN